MRGLVIGFPIAILLWVAIFSAGVALKRAVERGDLPVLHLGGER